MLELILFSMFQILSTLDRQVQGESKEEWVETIGFCPDKSVSLASYGTLNGYLFIWDLAHQVSIFLSLFLQINQSRGALWIFQRNELKLDKDLKFSGLVQNAYVYHMAKSQENLTVSFLRN